MRQQTHTFIGDHDKIRAEKVSANLVEVYASGGVAAGEFLPNIGAHWNLTLERAVELRDQLDAALAARLPIKGARVVATGSQADRVAAAVGEIAPVRRIS